MSVKVVNNFLEAALNAERGYEKINLRTQHIWIDENGFPRARIVQHDSHPFIVAEPKDCEIPREVIVSTGKYMNMPFDQVKCSVEEMCAKVRE